MEEIAAIAMRIADRAGLPLFERLAVLLAAALVVYVVGRLGNVRISMPPGDPTQTDARDDSTPRTDKPDAKWGTNDGPPGGGMEGG